MSAEDKREELVSALMTFGFTNLESLVYCQLLRRSPSTSYRIAMDIGRSPANIYKTLGALLQKGGIVAAEEESDTPSYMPVPPKQLFSRIRRDFEKRHDEALEALDAIHAPMVGEAVYQLRNAGHVLERAREMLDRAREVVVFDMMPLIYDVLRADIAGARDRGVRVVGIAYRPEDATPTVPYNGETPADVMGRWPGQGLILVIDGREQLIAQLSVDLGSVMNAVYSDSIFLSSVLHSAVSSDIRLVALRSDPSDPLRDLTLADRPPPGLRAIRGKVEGQ